MVNIMRRWIIFLLLLFITACRNEEPAAMGFVQENFAYIASENRVLVLNIADEAEPALVADVTLPGQVMKVVADGRFLYIAHQPGVLPAAEGPPDSGLQIVDISDPTQPTRRGFFRTADFPTDVAVQGDVAYLSEWGLITVVDMSDKDNPTATFTIASGARSVFVSGARLYASHGGCSFRTGFCEGVLHIYDVTNPVRPYPAGDLTVDQLPGQDIVVASDHAFIGGRGVWIVDVANEEDLAVNGRFEFEDLLFPAKVVVQENIAYGLLGDGLHLLDISQPAAPVLLGQYETDNYLQELTVQGDIAYLIGWNGLEIVNVADPANPQQIGSFAFANPVPNAPQPTATP
ncbi:MAG: hypothetical protein CL608_07320 [Anaerolineaceae bacterium]|nr:hypothetical protein [Anaerolineaceae bacterium]